MKFIVTKDEHLQLGFRNKFRKPSWEKDIFLKHNFIINFMLKNNIKYKITTGDILDKQTNWSFKQYLENKKILDLYKENGLEIISIAGNHDMIEGRNTIDQSVFKEFIDQDLIRWVGGRNNHLFLYNENEIELEIHGIDYQDPTLISKEDFLNKIKSIEIRKPDLKQVLIIHQNVTPNKNRVTEFTYDELSEICQEKEIHYLICGHYHIGFPTIIINNVTIINPWNLWRVVRDYGVKEDEHTPEMVLIDTDKNEFQHIEIPYKKYQDAFNLVEIDSYKKIKKQFSFIKDIDLNINIEDNEKDLVYNFLGNKLKEKGVSDEMLKLVYKEIDSRLDLN